MEGITVVPLMLGQLYAALRTANVPGDQARAAAEEVAGFELRISRIDSDLRIIKWMVGSLIALQFGFGLGNLWVSFNILGRLPR
jgi:hypothetical protein